MRLPTVTTTEVEQNLIRACRLKEIPRKLSVDVNNNLIKLVQGCLVRGCVSLHWERYRMFVSLLFLVWLV